MWKISRASSASANFKLEITDTTFAFERDQAVIAAEARLDGIYVLRNSVDADTLDPAGIAEGYKKLAHVESDFRTLKTDYLDLRPIHHWRNELVRAYVLISTNPQVSTRISPLQPQQLRPRVASVTSAAQRRCLLSHGLGVPAV